MIRRLIIFCAFVALTIAGLTTTVISIRQRSLLVRGWRDAATTPDLPVHGPLLGVNVELTQYDSTALNRELDRIAAAGFTWVRQPFRWSEISPSKDTFDFSRYDEIVRAVTAHPSLQIVAVLDETPAWARHVGAEGSRFAPPSSAVAFGEFAGKTAARYADSIKYFQVWDEPNLTDHWGGLDPRPADYVAMLRAAYTAIHEADAGAMMIAAALAPTVEIGPRNLSDVEFLHEMYADGGKPYFDAAAGKPYGFDSSPEDRTVNADLLNFSRIVLLREEMERQGDGAKPLWGSNFGWNSLPPDWKGAPSIWGQVDAVRQEVYTRAAYARAASEWPWMAGLILEHWSPAASADDPIQGFAIHRRIDDWTADNALAPVRTDNNLEAGLHPPTDPRVSTEGAWRKGPLGLDVQQNPGDAENSLTTSFNGDSLSLLVRRADYVAYLYVTVDGQPANALPHDADNTAYLLLTSPDRQPHTDLIAVARGLAPGVHQVKLRAYLGYDRWAIAGIAVGSAPDTHSADVLIASGVFLLLISIVGLAWSARGLPWSRLAVWRPAVLGYMRRMRDIGFTVAVSLVTLVGMFLTWGGALPNVFRRDPPAVLLTAISAGLLYFSPAFVITAASIVILFLIIYNRPPLGLCLIVFWAPFFLMPVQLYLLALPMVEVSLGVTAAAVTVRGLVNLFVKPSPQPLSQRRGANDLDSTISGGEVKSLHPLDFAMLAFVAAAILTLVWSEQRAPALRELRTMALEPALFFLMLRRIPLSRRDTLRLIDTLLAAGVAVCLIGLEQYFLTGRGIVTAEQGSVRLASVYGSPNNVALFLGRCIPFAFAMTLFRTGTLRRVAAAAVIVIMLITVALTQSLGGLLLGIPAALVVVLLAWDRRKGLIITGGLAAVLGGGVLLLPRFVPRLQGWLDGSRASSFVRVRVWESAINLLRERPLTGAGLDQFLYLYRSRYILPDAWREPDLSHPHNVVLDYWVSLGIAGLVIFAALQGFFWWAILAAYRRACKTDILVAALCAGAMGSMADFLAHGLVDNSYFVIDLSYIFCLTLALAIRWQKPVEMTSSPAPSPLTERGSQSANESLMRPQQG